VLENASLPFLENKDGPCRSLMNRTCGLPRRCGVVKFILLAAEAVSSAPQEHKAGACEWLAFGVIASLGLFICWNLFWNDDCPPDCCDCCEDDCPHVNPDHEFWV